MNRVTTPVSARSADRPSVRLRDAGRSRELILDAAEDLLAQRGYDGVALGEIAAKAGLSRGTPSYFFGSKAELYTAVLERAFQQREQAVRHACSPVIDWARRDGELAALPGALGQMVSGYMSFLLANPAFVKLVVRESLDGGQGLHRARPKSQAMVTMFEALRKSVQRRGLGSFEVDDALLLLLGLTFAPVANRDTYLARLSLDLERADAMRRHERLVVEQLLALILNRDVPSDKRKRASQ